MALILIADDEDSIRLILRRTLEKKGHLVITANNGTDAETILKEKPIDIAFLDIRMPGKSGLKILNSYKNFDSHPVIFIMTAQDTMDNAIEAMKNGAADYIVKPFDLDEVQILVQRALATRRSADELRVLKEEASAQAGEDSQIVGRSKAIREIFKVIGRVANQDVTVLIEGESGSGKELIARAIHSSGNRAPYPFVAVNCSAIPDNLLESELFGYRKGAFTGAQTDRAGYIEKAHLGTIFLDEIGDMPLPLQAKILRILQDKQVTRLGDTEPRSIDVRVVAATNQELKKKVKAGEFREDLYFRLNVVPVRVPPLRERPDDIPYLANHFLKKMAEDLEASQKGVSREGMEYLKKRTWRGNVRELENLIKRVSVLFQDPILESSHFEQALQSDIAIEKASVGDEGIEEFLMKVLPQRLLGVTDSGGWVHEHYVGLMERPLIRAVLRKFAGNQLKAADFLGINRNTLRKKIRDLKVDRRQS